MKRVVLICVTLPLCQFVLPRSADAETTFPAFRLTPEPKSDRLVRPFEGSLGRPCGYRWRETPSGTRKVRVCY
ncbi:MAG: hypothetical protein K2Y56_21520 [Methylobacterium sp.]|uniref:hypothetical protein n=1 Tax=Methylobacterium sp. TaxID=409 RepID=UPI0025E1CC01|nr:hypothetical protein [Methylobacterium sp.]MBX9934064.1 hypothetical protein [Methylobacterium sp.]